MSEERMKDMTLRDWFAGQALDGYLASWPESSSAPGVGADAVARVAYQLADAMMRVRNE